MRHIYKFISWEDYESQKEYLSIPNIVYIDNQSIIIANGVDEVTAAMPERLPLPVISCANNEVTITCDEPLVTIYYTTDGTEATTDSTVYTGPFIIHESCGVNALVVKYGYLPNTGYNWCEYEAPTGSVITYTATAKVNPSSSVADASIVSHEFSEGNGIITFDTNVTTIKSGFGYNNDLQTITLPGTVVSIGDYAFRSCKGLTNIEIPNGLKTIGREAFAYCSGLTNIEIPNGLDTIGKQAFAYCTSLTSVYCNAVTPPTITNPETNYIFDSCSNLTSIYVPAESVDSYKVAPGWDNYANLFQAIPE